MNLEDTHLDVLLKAQKALGITDRDLIRLSLCGSMRSVCLWYFPHSFASLSRSISPGSA